jgi:hypothetical protein
MAGTGPPVVAPEERSPVGTVAVEVRTLAVAAGASRPAPAGRSEPKGSVPMAPQAVQSHHPRSALGRAETRPTERRHHCRRHDRTRARHRAGSRTDRR